jgi:peptidoglycan hydrolase-like protein with peptidoglycan-binding domain
MLSALSAYIPEIPAVAVDGIFGPATRSAVIAAQRRFGLSQTGVVNETTWDEIYDQFAGIENRSLLAVPAESAAIATFSATPSQNRPRNNASTSITQFPGTDLRLGHQDPPRQEVLV